MNPNDVYEQRAERGRHRGAAEVWAAAQHDVHAEQATSAAPDASARWWSVASFRFAFVAISVAALAFLLIPFDVFETATDPASAPVLERDEGTEPTAPAQILIEGLTLETVFDPSGVPTMDSPAPANEVGRTWVFTHPTDPYDHPVAVGTATASGRSLTIVNGTLGDDDPIAEFIDGAWQAADSTDYVLDTEFDRPETVDAPVWQFEFRDGDEGATVQSTGHDGGEEWRWILRSLASSTTFQPVEVLGHEGVELIEADGTSQVIWTAGDDVFRLTATHIIGDVSSGAASAPVVDRLYEADDAEWERAVADAEGQGGITVGTVAVPASLILGITAAVGIGLLGWLVFRRRASDDADE